MKIEIITTPTFDREYKRLKRIYTSLPKDMLLFENDLTNNPNIGVDLGGDVRKVLIAIKSKNKGKSGGARIIIYHVTGSVKEEKILLVTIFDKSKLDNISVAEIKHILRECGF